MTLTSRAMITEDLPFFEQLVSESQTWEELELTGLTLAEYISHTQHPPGRWRIWEAEGKQVAITFDVKSAPSNQKPWLGTILVAKEARRTGLARRIIDAISTELLLLNEKVLFTGFPAEQDAWRNFLSYSGFEQFKLESSEGREYLIMIRPLE